MKAVIDDFAVRVFESKNEAYTNILKEVSGLYSALRGIIAGAPLLRVQVNIILLSDIALTMKIGRSIPQQYYGLTERKHSHVLKELENLFLHGSGILSRSYAGGHTTRCASQRVL